MIFPIYSSYEETYFLERLNRFVMRLQRKNGETIQAHVPNTGRMEEFCFEGQPFFITPLHNTKYAHKVVATRYQEHVVFLDTLKTNELFSQLLANNCIPQFQNVTAIQREVTFGDSRFDFTFSHHQKKIIAEIKSCTLCDNSLAMFPDAPTLRGQKHLATLERLAHEEYFTSHVVFLILNASAERFIPNFHTDFDYGMLFQTVKHVRFHAYTLNFIDPVTADLSSLQEVPIDLVSTEKHCRNKGSYLLIMENTEDRTIPVGKLGDIFFSKRLVCLCWICTECIGCSLTASSTKTQKETLAYRLYCFDSNEG